MNGSRAVLDSNVIIFLSKGQLNVDKLFDRYDHFFISLVTYMEVYGFSFGNEYEKALVDELFAQLEIVGIHMEIAEQTIEYRKNGVKKIRLPDAIILATACHLNADLVTDDWDDFSGIDETVKVVDLSFAK